MKSYYRDRLAQLANHLTQLGFKVYVSTSKQFNYGFYSTSDTDVAVGFEVERLTGLYKFGSVCRPSRQYGTGCQLNSFGCLTEVTSEALAGMVTKPMPGWYKRPEVDRLSLAEKVSECGDRVKPFCPADQLSSES